MEDQILQLASDATGPAIAAWAVTEITSQFWKGWHEAHRTEMPWWSNGTLRVLSLLIGVLVGMALLGLPEGVTPGLLGGAFPALWLWGIKRVFRFKQPDSTGKVGG